MIRNAAKVVDDNPAPYLLRSSEIGNCIHTDLFAYSPNAAGYADLTV